jgi:NAD(P)H-dependent flavin oxidoreductase YrpB (nitropropane dioxygenase family)
MTNAVLHTPACSLFGVRYPIVQTGMGWVAGANLTAATSAAGGLGILASATMDLTELARAIESVHDRTDRPFGVNLRSDQPDVDRRIELMVATGVKVASFAQAPGERLVKTLKDQDVVVMPTVGARRHAEKVAAWGVDAVIAQGAEGGGHTGTVPTSLLLPQVCDAVDIPVIAAGGFFDGRGLVSALAYGAAGVAMGTRFLLSAESRVPDAVKQRYLEAAVTDTVVTKQVDGHPQRVIRTALVDHLDGAGRVMALPRSLANALRFRKLSGRSLTDLAQEGIAMHRSQDLSWAQVAMGANAPMLTKAALVDGNLDAGVLPTGQVVGVIEALPTVASIVETVMAEAERTLARLGGAGG